MEPFRHVVILHGCAVGGWPPSSANPLLVPRDSVWEGGSWAGLADWKTEIRPHFETAMRMLGVSENRILGPSDHTLQRAAETAGVGDTFYRTQVAVFESPEGEPGGQTCPDPYFGGEGPERTTCIGCGGCMVGCRFNAKNTLDKNYLYLAENRGMKLFAQTRVVDVKPLDGASDGARGYEVRTAPSAGRTADVPARLTCRGIVFAASSLGTQELLFQLKDRGSLP